MSEEDTLPSVPFKPPDEKIASSRTRDVFGYNDDKLVIKVHKPGQEATEKDFHTDVLTAAKRIEFYRDLIREEIKLAQGDPKIVIPSHTVIHDSSTPGEPTYADVQTRINSSQTLKKMGKSVLDLPEQSLQDLKSIFIASNRLFEKTGRPIDLVGSTDKKRSIKTEILRNFFPLEYSENILVDDNNKVHLIDSEVDIRDKRDLRFWVRSGLQYVGSKISIALIDKAIEDKHKKLHTPGRGITAGI